jgi:hypothetical protein
MRFRPAGRPSSVEKESASSASGRSDNDRRRKFFYFHKQRKSQTREREKNPAADAGEEINGSSTLRESCSVPEDGQSSTFQVHNSLIETQTERQTERAGKFSLLMSNIVHCALSSTLAASQPLGTDAL